MNGKEDSFKKDHSLFVAVLSVISSIVVAYITSGANFRSQLEELDDEIIRAKQDWDLKVAATSNQVVKISNDLDSKYELMTGNFTSIEKRVRDVSESVKSLTTVSGETWVELTEKSAGLYDSKNGGGYKIYPVVITYGKEFERTPDLVIALSGFYSNTPSSGEHHIHAYINSKNETEAKISVKVWEETKLKNIGISWTAIGKIK
jgi:hypothetical protein